MAQGDDADNLGTRISFTTKELLQEVREDVKLVLAQLSTKADRTLVESMGGRVDLIQERTLLLESEMKSRREHGEEVIKEFRDFKRTVEENVVYKHEFSLVQKIVFGFVGLVLVAVVTALLALVILP